MYVMKRFPSRGIFLGVSVEHTFPTNSLNCRVLDAPSRKFEVTRAVRNITERISVPHEMPLSAYTRKYRICLIYIYTILSYYSGILVIGRSVVWTRQYLWFELWNILIELGQRCTIHDKITFNCNQLWLVSISVGKLSSVL